MIYVGIDDTDVIDSPGTNQLARAIATAVRDRWQCLQIVRHQLLFDPRVPYTSHNGSASLVFVPQSDTAPEQASIADLTDHCRRVMRDWFVPGSDPGLCVTQAVPQEVISYAWRCQHELMDQAEARSLAEAHGIHLEGLGGTEGGVIGALAAVGLAVTGDDGRIIQWRSWPDDLTGAQPLSLLQARGVSVCDYDSLSFIDRGLVDVGKHLRPNLRGGRAVLYARSTPVSRTDVTHVALKVK